MASDLAIHNPANPTTVKPTTHVIIVLDRSGSMQSIWQPMKTALKDQIANLGAKKREQRIRLWFALFDTDYEIPHLREKLKNVDVERLMTDHPPRGSTALFDALSDTVLRVEEEVKDDCAFLCIVVTDGFENASQRIDGPTLKATLERLQKTDRWTFVYLGANQDITQVSQTTGINTASTMAYAATPDSVFATMGANSPTTSSVDHYFTQRSAGVTSTETFFAPEDDPDDDQSPPA